MDEIYKLFGQNTFTCREYPGDWMTLRKLNNSGFLTRVERGGYKKVNKYKINDKWIDALQENPL